MKASQLVQLHYGLRRNIIIIMMHMYCDKISHSCIAIVYMRKLAPWFKTILWDVSGIPKNGVGFALVADCEVESAVCSRILFVQMRSPTLFCVLLSGNRGDQLWYAPPHPTYHRYNNNKKIKRFLSKSKGCRVVKSNTGPQCKLTRNK